MQSKEQQVFDAIKIHFDTDKRRVKFISYLIVSLLKITTCALSEWSRAIAQPTQRASRYKRLQRFVSQFRFSGRIYARLVWSVFGQGKQVVLTLDRTEYQMRGQWVQPGRRSGVDVRHCPSGHQHSSDLAHHQSPG